MIGISMRMMRVSYPSGNVELRDCLDISWSAFLKASLPEEDFVPLPNIGADIDALLGRLPLTGIILSGGDDWGLFAQRDGTERRIFNFARARKLPLLGVCRGAQIINVFLGAPQCQPVSGHVATRHDIVMNNGCRRQVNSFHKLAIMDGSLAPGLLQVARTEDGSVEAFKNGDNLLHGIMWHPEREAKASPDDIAMMRNIFHRIAI